MIMSISMSFLFLWMNNRTAVTKVTTTSFQNQYCLTSSVTSYDAAVAA